MCGGHSVTAGNVRFVYTPSSCVANNIEGKFYDVIATVILENMHTDYTLWWSNFSPAPFE